MRQNQQGKSALKTSTISGNSLKLFGLKGTQRYEAFCRRKAHISLSTAVRISLCRPSESALLALFFSSASRLSLSLVKTSVCTCRSALKLDTGAFTTARVRWQALSYKACYNFLRVVNEPTYSTLEWKTSRRKNTSNQLLTSSASYDLLFSPKMKKDGTSIERI